MKKTIFILFVTAFLSGISYAQNEIKITLKNNTQAELQTKAQLQRLLKIHDLAKWTFTDSIVIDEESIPHSHPKLTLHTRHLKDDELLLSTYVHEQFHWYLVQNRKETETALKELRGMFPKVPVGFPEGGKDEESTYLHLLVCYLEYQADKDLFGELKAKQVMDFWSNDHYTWIVKTVVERQREIAGIMLKNKLFLPKRT